MLTRSPTLTLTSFTFPLAGEGTSMVALSDSSETRGSSFFTSSPGLTNTWMTGTSLKSPISGTCTSCIAILPLYSIARRMSASRVVRKAVNRAAAAPSITRWS